MNTRISSFIQSSDSFERLGGVYALDNLVDLEGVESSVKFARYTQALKTVLRGKDINPMQPAAVALGKLCRPGGALTSELVESEVNNAIEWLQNDRIEERRYAAILVLRELSRAVPTLMWQYVAMVLEWVWVGLRDVRQLIRTASAETVCAALRIIRERDKTVSDACVVKLYNEAISAVKPGAAPASVEHVHGSLLCLKELLENGGMFMTPHYQAACDAALRFRDHRDPMVRKTVVSLIPDLASYSPVDFANVHMHKFMAHLISMLKNPKERNDAFIAIGNIASSVKSSIAPYLDAILINVREGLSVQSRKRGSIDPVFDCISRLAVSVG